MSNLFTFFVGLILAALGGNSVAYSESLIPEKILELGSSWPEVSANLWVNTRDDKPIVHVGDSIYFFMENSEPAHFVLFVVDSQKKVSILRPFGAAEESVPKSRQIFPDIPQGCDFPVNAECERTVDSVIADAPLGDHVAILLASTSPISKAILGLSIEADFRSLQSRPKKISEFIFHLEQYIEQKGIRVAGFLREFSIVENNTVPSLRNSFFAQNNRSLILKYENRETGSAPNIQRTLGDLLREPLHKTSISRVQRFEHFFNQITFLSGSTTLDLESRDKLVELGNQIQNILNTDEYMFLQIGVPANNLVKTLSEENLSLRRAKTVKMFLQKRFGLTDKSVRVQKNMKWEHPDKRIVDVNSDKVVVSETGAIEIKLVNTNSQ